MSERSLVLISLEEEVLLLWTILQVVHDHRLPDLHAEQLKAHRPVVEHAVAAYVIGSLGGNVVAGLQPWLDHHQDRPAALDCGPKVPSGLG